MSTLVAVGIGAAGISIIIWIIKGTWWMIKLLVKLVKYGILLYLLIFIKNIYSDTFSAENSVITISKPRVINISELDSYIEQDESLDLQDNDDIEISRTEEYRKLLEEGLALDSSDNMQLSAEELLDDMQEQLSSSREDLAAKEQGSLESEGYSTPLIVIS